MNNPNYQYAMPYPNQNFQPNQPNLDSSMYPTPQPLQPGQISDFEESYIENIIRLNRGKLATFYMSYSDSNEWRDRVYRGVIEAAGVDHIIISDPRDGKRYILLNIYLDWVEFNEEINYDYPLR